MKRHSRGRRAPAKKKKPKKAQPRAKASSRRATKARPQEGSILHEEEIAKAMREATSDAEVHAFIELRSVREETARNYLACAERLDAVARKGGYPEGMRSTAAFIRYVYARMKTQLTGGASTLTYQRSALEFRERVEGATDPWTDEEHIRRCVSIHLFEGKGRNAKARRRGALTWVLLKQILPATSEELHNALSVQYLACLRPREVLGLTVGCVVAEKGRDVIVIDDNKAFRRTNAHNRTATQRKPLSPYAARMIRIAVNDAVAQGKREGERLFSLTKARYRQLLAAAMTKSKVPLPTQLQFVPHSVRHGRVVDLRMSNPEMDDLTDEQLEEAGMSRQTSRRYRRTNEERLALAGPLDTVDDSSSSDESEPDRIPEEEDEYAGATPPI